MCPVGRRVEGRFVQKLFAEILAQETLEFGRIAERDARAVDVDKLQVSKFGESAGEGFGDRSELGGEGAFGASEGDGERGLSNGLGALFQEPVREAGFDVLECEILNLSDEDVEMDGHGSEHAKGELGALAQHFNKALLAHE